MHLQKAFLGFFKKTAKKPKFKSKGKCRDSFSIANDKLTVDGNRVRLPIIGWVKLRESLRFSGKIIAAVVSRTADHWYISFQVNVDDINKSRTQDNTVGVDLGIKSLAVTSNGEVHDSPKPLRRFLGKLKRLQKQFSRKVKGSNRREKLKTKIARLHARIRNIRHDCLHKLTTKLCRENQTVVVEDLCLKGMFANRKLSRAVSDIGLFEFRRQLEYKAKMYGTKLVVINRWYPSSKTCSNCQNVKSTLLLTERTYRCSNCGVEIDRDLNAAINIHAAGLAVLARGLKGSDTNLTVSVKPCQVEARTKPCPFMDTN